MITTSGEDAPAATEEPLTLQLGHPVRNFALLLLSIAAVLAGLWWTGAVGADGEGSPRVLRSP